MKRILKDDITVRFIIYSGFELNGSELVNVSTSQLSFPLAIIETNLCAMMMELCYRMMEYIL